MPSTTWIPVLPKNYRRIALYAIGLAEKPLVLVDRREVRDFSESGPLTQAGIRSCRDFEIRDGEAPILGFHDHPREMWVDMRYRALAEHCAAQGWLKLEGNVS